MNKAIITLEDADGSVDLRVDFEPDLDTLDPRAEPTPAQLAALAAVQFIVTDHFGYDPEDLDPSVEPRMD